MLIVSFFAKNVLVRHSCNTFSLFASLVYEFLQGNIVVLNE